jgi:hypothetical protein
MDTEEIRPETPIEVIEEELVELDAQPRVIEYRWLALLQEFDQRRGWESFRSCLDWLRFKRGKSAQSARDHLRVARALKRLRRLSAAMADGSICFTKARALLTFATPRNEALLVTMARQCTATHVERIVRQYRRRTDAEDSTLEQPQHALGSVSFELDNDGTYVVHCSTSKSSPKP